MMPASPKGAGERSRGGRCRYHRKAANCAFTHASPRACTESLHREWHGRPSLQNAIALDRLAELPDHLTELLVRDDTVRSIHIGTGGVPDLDDMGALRGNPGSS